MNFNQLIKILSDTHDVFQLRAVKSINVNLTLRNWFFGMYIVEFEQNGKDRAEYGERLLREIASKLKSDKSKGLSFTNLNLYRQFYSFYPQIIQTVSEQFNFQTIKQLFPVQKATINQLEIIVNQKLIEKNQTVSEQFVHSAILLQNLSFSHFVELIKCESDLQRTFYEIECIKATWSVRELKRQINSLLFERTGLSKNKKILLQNVNHTANKILPEEVIRDPYVFEFVGLKPKDVFTENDLETALLTHLQEFLLELGKGFCFVARQKRINIGGDYFKIDMVFYHRILRCNVLIELKTREFQYSDVTQLNVYVNYYKKYEMLDDENPPIGILLCTTKNEALVEFSTEGVDNQLFISKYKVALPTKKELKLLLQNEMKYIERK